MAAFIKAIFDSTFGRLYILLGIFSSRGNKQKLRLPPSISGRQRGVLGLAERGFDPRTSGLWAQHASTAPLCLSDKHYRSANTNIDTY